MTVGRAPALDPVAALSAGLERLSRRLVKHAQAAHAQEHEAVHDLRVTCRRLETRLRLWSRHGDARPVREAVRGLRRAAGDVRDAEVVAALLMSGALGARTIPRALRERWQAVLARRRARQRLPSRVSVERVVRAIEGWRSRVTDWAARAGRAERRTRRYEKRARTQLAAALQDGGPEALHEARLAIKRWRYAAEAAGAAMARPAAEARRWQRALGALNDRSTLASFVARQGAEGRRHALRLESLRRAALLPLRRRLAAHAVPQSARSPRG